MRLLLISEFFPDTKDLKFSGGVEARDYFVAKKLAKNNQVTVLTSALGRLPREEKIGKLRILRVGKFRSYRATTGNVGERVGFIRDAIDCGISLDVDLVEGSNFITHYIAARIAQRKRIPAVAWYPDVWIGEWFKNAGIVGLSGEILERLNLRHDFSLFIAISKQTAKKLQKHAKKKVVVIPCGVETAEFKGTVKKSQPPVVLSIGRLAPYKNHPTVIEAMALLKDIDCRLVIVGNGPLEKNLKQLVKDKKLTSKIEFLKDVPRKRLIELMKSATVFVSASKVEGFGIATIEAAAAGLPFVAGNIDVIKEVTLNGKGGFLVNPDDSAAYAKKIEQLLTDRTLYSKKSEEARKLSEQYDWDRIALETEKVFKSLS